MTLLVLVATARYRRQAARLPAAARRSLAARHLRLAGDPKHPSLRTRAVEGAVGDFGGKVFEASVGERYRLTWEDGPGRGDITLRNVDSRDDCLAGP